MKREQRLDANGQVLVRGKASPLFLILCAILFDLTFSYPISFFDSSTVEQRLDDKLARSWRECLTAQCNDFAEQKEKQTKKAEKKTESKTESKSEIKSSRSGSSKTKGGSAS